MTYLGYDLTLEMSLNSEDDKIHFVYSILYVLKRRFLSLKSFLTLRRDKSVTNIDNEKSWWRQLQSQEMRGGASSIHSHHFAEEAKFIEHHNA